MLLEFRATLEHLNAIDSKETYVMGFLAYSNHKKTTNSISKKHKTSTYGISVWG